MHVRGQLPCTLASLHWSIGVIFLLKLMIWFLILWPNIVAQNFFLCTWGGHGLPLDRELWQEEEEVEGYLRHHGCRLGQGMLPLEKLEELEVKPQWDDRGCPCL